MLPKLFISSFACCNRNVFQNSILKTSFNYFNILIGILLANKFVITYLGVGGWGLTLFISEIYWSNMIVSLNCYLHLLYFTTKLMMIPLLRRILFSSCFNKFWILSCWLFLLLWLFYLTLFLLFFINTLWLLIARCIFSNCHTLSFVRNRIELELRLIVYSALCLLSQNSYP